MTCFRLTLFVSKLYTRSILIHLYCNQNQKKMRPQEIGQPGGLNNTKYYNENAFSWIINIIFEPIYFPSGVGLSRLTVVNSLLSVFNYLLANVHVSNFLGPDHLHRIYYFLK